MEQASRRWDFWTTSLPASEAGGITWLFPCPNSDLVRGWSDCFSGGLQSLVFGPSPYKPLAALGWIGHLQRARQVLPILHRPGTSLGGVNRRSHRALQQPSQELLEWLLPSPARGKHPGMEAVAEPCSSQGLVWCLPWTVEPWFWLQALETNAT